jgi:hypothetical protein
MPAQSLVAQQLLTLEAVEVAVSGMLREVRAAPELLF